MSPRGLNILNLEYHDDDDDNDDDDDDDGDNDDFQAI